MIKAGEFRSFKPSFAGWIGWALLYLFALVLATVLFPISFWAVWSGVPMLGIAIIMGFPMMVMVAVLVAASCLSLLPSIGLVFSVFWFGSMRRERRYQMAMAPVCLAEAVVRVETSGTAGEPATITSGQRGVLFGRDLNSEVTLRLIGRSQVGVGEEGTAELCFPRNAERPTGLGQGVEFELFDFRRRPLGRGVISRLWFRPAR